MAAVLKLLLLLALSLVDCRLLPRITSFDKELTFRAKRVILGSSKDVITDSESFLYVTCGSQEDTFKSNRCNVTLETPAFSSNNATYRDACVIDLAPPTPRIESLRELKLWPFGDDKALLSWLVVDEEWRAKLANVRVLLMSNCKFTDVVLPAEEVQSIVTYDTTFDVVLKNKTFCGSSENCRLSYDLTGKKLAGPAQFLANVKLRRLVSLVPATPRGGPVKGFYALATTPTDHRYSLLQISAEGKGAELLSIPDHSIARLSNAYDALAVCWTSERTNVTCRQYDARTGQQKTSVVLGFLDDPGFGAARWIQPHNLREGGLLLVTGQVSDKKERRFESFTLIRIYGDGHRDRPLEIGGLDFECTSVGELHVDVAENGEDDELCIHFVCERIDFGEQGSKNTLKFSTKCLPKRHVTMSKRQPSVVN